MLVTRLEDGCLRRLAACRSAFPAGATAGTRREPRQWSRGHSPVMIETSGDRHRTASVPRGSSRPQDRFGVVAVSGSPDDPGAVDLIGAVGDDRTAATGRPCTCWYPFYVVVVAAWNRWSGQTPGRGSAPRWVRCTVRRRATDRSLDRRSTSGSSDPNAVSRCASRLVGALRNRVVLAGVT